MDMFGAGRYNKGPPRGLRRQGHGLERGKRQRLYSKDPDSPPIYTQKDLIGYHAKSAPLSILSQEQLRKHLDQNGQVGRMLESGTVAGYVLESNGDKKWTTVSWDGPISPEMRKQRMSHARKMLRSKMNRGPITTRKAVIGFNAHYDQARNWSGKTIEGAAHSKQRDIMTNNAAHHVREDTRYLTNPGLYEFDGVDYNMPGASDYVRSAGQKAWNIHVKKTYKSMMDQGLLDNVLNVDRIGYVTKEAKKTFKASGVAALASKQGPKKVRYQPAPMARSNSSPGRFGQSARQRGGEFNW